MATLRTHNASIAQPGSRDITLDARDLSADELRELLAASEQARMVAEASLAVAQDALPKPRIAFVPTVTVAVRPAGFDRYAHEGVPQYDANGVHIAGSGRRGMFLTTAPKLAVTITRKSGKPVEIAESPAVWAAILGASDEILAALA